MNLSKLFAYFGYSFYHVYFKLEAASVRFSEVLERGVYRRNDVTDASET